jgi:MFS family permease
MNSEAPALTAGLTRTQWLICIIASIGFAFDIYELLVWPLISRPALAQLLNVDPFTTSGFDQITAWNTYIMWGSAICGGVFGLLGGYLTDIFGRRTILTWSILLYAFSALASGFATTPEVLLVLRCTTFIGVCVEFVAAVAWLAELFPDPKTREKVLGYTQAFSSVGGLLVTIVYGLCSTYRDSLPPIFGGHDPWRYTLISGVLPALPLIIIRPFLPESPVWQQKREAGTLRRPSLAGLFTPEFARTTIITAILFSCSYGAAFGAIQLTPQIVPGLNKAWAELPKLRKQIDELSTSDKESPLLAELKKKANALDKEQQASVKNVQLSQELGGLLGRFLLAVLATQILHRGWLYRVFVIPGCIVMPLTYFFPAAGQTPEAVLNMFGGSNITLLAIGIFLVGFCTVGQFSFWGNYLPRMYPVHLRGTGESFAANIGGRMFGTSANALTTFLFAPMFVSMYSSMPRPTTFAFGAAVTGTLVYVVALVLSFWLPEPNPEHDKH